MTLTFEDSKIKDLVDRLCFDEFGLAQSGSDSPVTTCQLFLLKRLGFPIPLDTYKHGEEIYKSGTRFSWNSGLQEYVRTTR